MKPRLALLLALGAVAAALLPSSGEDANAAERDTSAAAPVHLAAAGESSQESLVREVVPPEAEDPAWLATRAQAQRKAAEGWKVFHDFGFRDRRKESGILFVHRIVEDSGKTWKPVHYDHGTGVAIADVDGDGRQDIYFANQLGNNALYRNLGDGRFEDITFQAGVQLFEKVSVGAAFADVDDDGDADLYVTTVRDGNVLFENDGKGRFSDASEKSGLGHKGHSSAAVFFDYDRDGKLDLFLLNIGVYTEETRGPGRFYIGFKDAFSGHLKPERFERSLLFRNEGGLRFKDVTTEVGIDDTRWSGDATPIDGNNDGWPDLYVLNMEGFDGYWENVEGKRFVDRSQELFPRSSWGAMGVKSFDFENDGDPDLFITDMHSDMSVVVEPEQEKDKAPMAYAPDFLADDGKGIYGNTFFRNEGDGSFREISDEIGAENFWPWGLSVGDLNADGYEDAFIASSMNFPWRYGINSILLNDRGQRFVDAEFVLGVEPRSDGRTVIPWFELDCGGDDKYHKVCVSSEHPKAHLQVMGAIGSRSSVLFDLDDDGDLDIVTNDFNSEPLVLISDLSERKPIHYVKVKLVGSRSNRDGLGARVVVRAGGQTYTRVLDGQSGYLSQSRHPLYFGIGEAEKIDEIRVRWPSGAEQKLAGPIEANRLIEIAEPD